MQASRVVAASRLGEVLNTILDAEFADHPGIDQARARVARIGVQLCDALDAPITSMRRLWLDNTSLSIIEEYRILGERFRRVLLFNDISHLT